jgi:hypothetical protein
MRANIAHDDAISLGRYVFSSSFGSDVMENWQSEFLQFSLYIAATVWLLQRGSPESKPMDKAGGESDEAQKVGEYATAKSPRWGRVGGWRTRVYSNSLLIVMTAIWLASCGVQSITGHVAYNADQFDHQLAAVSWLGYVSSADFLEPHTPELAVGVPRRRLDGGVQHLPPPARLTACATSSAPPASSPRRCSSTSTPRG